MSLLSETKQLHPEEAGEKRVPSACTITTCPDLDRLHTNQKLVTAPYCDGNYLLKQPVFCLIPDSSLYIHLNPLILKRQGRSLTHHTLKCVGSPLT